MKKEILIIWSRDRPRPPLLESCNQGFPSLAKRVAPVSLYQNIVPTKCLRNQLGMVRSITIGLCNWCSLTSASPPLTKIIDRRKTFIDLASFRPFLQEGRAPEEGYKEPLFGPTKRKTVCSLSGGNFDLKDFSI